MPDTIWSNANPDHIRGINERGYPSFSTPIYHESFTDYNANGTRDIGEPFIDMNENNEKRHSFLRWSNISDIKNVKLRKYERFQKKIIDNYWHKRFLK